MGQSGVQSYLLCPRVVLHSFYSRTILADEIITDQLELCQIGKLSRPDLALNCLN